MKNTNRPKIIAIVGPTASGKTSLAVSVSKVFGGEVVSADSMQIYRGMDIATAKPSVDEMDGVKHHLIDFLPSDEVFSVASFVDMAHKAINDILDRSNLPVVTGGTGLYIDNLISGTSFADGDTDFELRNKLVLRVQNEGLDSLLSELKEIDPESYERLKDSNNAKRIIRALEVYMTTGITMTEQNLNSKPSDKPYNCTKIVLGFNDRECLYNRINLRVDKMLEAGLLKEAESFFSSSCSNTAVQAIGYKELKPYFTGECSLDEAVESLKRATRRYAKRQITWFKRDETAKWFYVDEYNSADGLFEAVKAFLITEGFELI